MKVLFLQLSNNAADKNLGNPYKNNVKCLYKLFSNSWNESDTFLKFYMNFTVHKGCISVDIEYGESKN